MAGGSDRDRFLAGLSEPALIVRGDAISAANPAAVKLLGKAVVGAGVRRIFANTAAIECLDGANSGERREIELSGLGGSRRHWLMRVAALGEDEQLVRFTDRSEARAAEQMRVDFVANASHELRTPLATLVGYAETLREQADEIDAATRERFLAVVHDEARRMQGIVEDLISLSRIEAERFTAPTAAIPVEPLVRQAVENARRQADERGARIVTSVSSALSPVAGDLGQLLQLLDNLITNALRYGEAGADVRVSADFADSMIRIAVEDSGEGIAPEHIERVTERFYRVDTSRSRSLGGTGLGLSIVKHIVERHRGQLKIASEVGRGTMVEVRLPVARSPQS